MTKSQVHARYVEAVGECLEWKLRATIAEHKLKVLKKLYHLRLRELMEDV